MRITGTLDANHATDVLNGQFNENCPECDEELSHDVKLKGTKAFTKKTRVKLQETCAACDYSKFISTHINIDFNVEYE